MKINMYLCTRLSIILSARASFTRNAKTQRKVSEVTKTHLLDNLPKSHVTRTKHSKDKFSGL